MAAAHGPVLRSALRCPGLRASLAAAAASRRLVLLLDFDGTLAPIVADPEAAAMAPGTARVLHALVAAGVPTAVVTGRSLERIRIFTAHAGASGAGSGGGAVVGVGVLTLAAICPHGNPR